MACCESTPEEKIIPITQYNTQIAIYLMSIRQLWIDAVFDVDVAFFQVPDNFDTDPGDVGEEVAQRDLALCIATISLVDTLFNQAMNYLRAVTPGFAALGIKAITIAAPLALPVFVAAAGSFALGSIGLAVAYTELQRQEYRDYIACTIYENLKGGDTNSKAAFDAALDTFPNPRPTPETPTQDIARDLIEVWMRSQINNLDNYLSFVRNLDAAMNYAKQAEDACPCADVWEHRFLGGWEQGELVILGWPGKESVIASYDPVADKIHADCFGVALTGVFAYVELVFAPTVITRVRMLTDYKVTRETPSDHMRIWNGVMDAGIKIAEHLPSGQTTTTVDTGTINTTISRLEFEVNAGTNDADCDAGCAEITLIIINGEGDDPFSP